MNPHDTFLAAFQDLLAEHEVAVGNWDMLALVNAWMVLHINELGPEAPAFIRRSALMAHHMTEQGRMH
jgi:hypothetical protein